MKVCVSGFWHQGTVIAACLAKAGYQVVGLEFDGESARQLQRAVPPVFEPGLAELMEEGIKAGSLRFSSDPAEALAGAEVVWITYDTPVNTDDEADVAYVTQRVERLFPSLREGMIVLISAQLPVGSTRALAEAFQARHPQKKVSFGYSPENLRLGRAIESFTQPGRIVVGTLDPADRPRMERLMAPFCHRLEWMSVESAEMTKHALNAFLATSVTFINELAVLCESVGADAKEVERGLKSEARIGPKAYLAPGGPFAGGTLARDIMFLTQVGAEHHVATHLLAAVRTSNDHHKQWVQRKLDHCLEHLHGKRIAIWGLTYKPGTNTLRRSAAVELCRWLAGQGASVQAHDPAVRELPKDLAGVVTLHPDPEGAAAGAHALVIATEWPEFRKIAPEAVLAKMAEPVVIDANRFLAESLGRDGRCQYWAVGKFGQRAVP